MPAAMLRNLPRGHPSGAFTPCDWQAPGRTIPDRFAEIADEFPERLATYDFTRRLTYAELDRAANRVANVLLAQCGGDREPVIILAGVNTTATVAAMGVFKANKFFVGLEPSFPLARARQIIADTQATVILAESEHLALARELAAPEHRIIDLDAVTTGDDAQAEDADRPRCDRVAELHVGIHRATQGRGPDAPLRAGPRGALCQCLSIERCRPDDEDRIAGVGRHVLGHLRPAVPGRLRRELRRDPSRHASARRMGPRDRGHGDVRHDDDHPARPRLSRGALPRRAPAPAGRRHHLPERRGGVPARLLQCSGRRRARHVGGRPGRGNVHSARNAARSRRRARRI